MSDNSVVGKFSLLVKRYPGGAASQYLHALPLGASVDFKHIPFNIKSQYPFEGKKTFTMICAGTGITPMFQALHSLLHTPGDERRITLLYGSKTADDILLKSELDQWASAFAGRLKLVYVVGTSEDAPAPEGWVDTPNRLAEGGWVDEAKVQRHAFAPSDETMVFVCGLPPMYETLCGPRTEPALPAESVLARLGYTEAMVAKM